MTLAGDAANDTLCGGEGSDTLSGIEFADLSGGNGNNVINARTWRGNTHIVARGGNDLVVGNRFAGGLVGDFDSAFLGRSVQVDHAGRARHARLDEEPHEAQPDLVLNAVGGDVRVRGVSGDVSLRADEPIRLEANTVSGDLSAFAAAWTNQQFNQGSPKPKGNRPGGTRRVTVTGASSGCCSARHNARSISPMRSLSEMGAPSSSSTW